MSAPSPAVLPKRSFGLRVLAVLAKLLALAGTVALTFQFGPRGLAAGLLFGFVVPWLIAVRPGAKPRRDPFRRGGLHRLRWAPQFRPWAVVSGLIAGLGTVMVLQQWSIQAMTSALMVRGVLGGLLGGVLVPSITWWFAVRRVNTRLGPGGASGPAGATAALAAITFLLLLPGGIAAAETSGPCAGAFGAEAFPPLDAATHDSLNEDDALTIHPGDRLRFQLQAGEAAVDGAFAVHYGPLSRPIDADILEGNTVDASALVDDYDWVGAGFYRVTGEAELASGATCTGAILLDLQVDPWTTLLGAIAATFASAGALGILGAALHDQADSTHAFKRYAEAERVRVAIESGSVPVPGAAVGAGVDRSLQDDGTPPPPFTAPPPFPAPPPPEGTAETEPSDGITPGVGAGAALAAGAGSAMYRRPEESDDDPGQPSGAETSFEARPPERPDPEIADAADAGGPGEDGPFPDREPPGGHPGEGIGGVEPAGGLDAGMPDRPEVPLDPGTGEGRDLSFGLPEEIAERVLDTDALQEAASAIPPGEEDDEEPDPEPEEEVRPPEM